MSQVGTQVKRDERARRHPRILVAVLGTAGILVYSQQAVVLPLVPNIPGHFGTDGATASWVVTATLLVGAMATPIFGRLGDMYGPRPLMIAALMSMLIGAVVCALATTVTWLIIGRVLAGGGLGVTPLALSILRQHLPPTALNGAVAFMGATSAVGIAVGPALAGFIGDLHLIFAVLAVMAAACLALVIAWLPSVGAGPKVRVDVLGAVVLTVVIVGILLPVSMGSVWGWGSPWVVGCFVTAPLAAGAWVLRELTCAHPFVDVRVNFRAPVVLTHVTGLFAGFAMFGNALITSMILQAPSASSYGFGFDLMDIGMVFIGGSVVMGLSASAAARILNQWGARRTFAIGALITVASYLGRIVVEQQLWLVLVCFGATYVGTAMALAALAVLAMDCAPLDRLTEVLGVQQVIRLIGQATSSCLIGASAGWFSVTIGGAQYASWSAIVIACMFTATASLVSIVVVRAMSRGARARMLDATSSS